MDLNRFLFHFIRTTLGIFLVGTITCIPILAQEDIPETSGFSGYLMFFPGYIRVESNMIASGAPALYDIGHKQIESIFEPLKPKSAPALGVGGELNYTFAKSRTLFPP